MCSLHIEVKMESGALAKISSLWLFLFISFIMDLPCIHAQVCANDPCLNNGECRPAILDPGYLCICPIRYVGRHCGFDIVQYFQGPNENILSCARVLSDTSGAITSPNYPNPAGFNENCFYSIRVPEATMLHLDVKFFESEGLKDDLYYKLGPDFDENFFLDEDLLRLNGNRTGRMFNYNTNQITFLWESDFSIRSPGFNIEYRIESDPCFNHQCQNGGICEAEVMTYVCSCPAEYTGQLCEQVLVLVLETMPAPSTVSAVVEGRTVQTVTFDLTFRPSSKAVAAVVGTGLWRVSAYFSGAASGSGTQLGATEVVLSDTQAEVSWIPPFSSTITQLQQSFIVNRALCSEMSYLCARISRGRSPSVNFEMAGDPTDDALLGCSVVRCLGVAITETLLIVTSGGTVREGFSSQPITFDISLQPNPAAGSVTGSDLWMVTVFGSGNANGEGRRFLQTPVLLTSVQSGADVVIGQITRLPGMSVQWNLQSEATCADIQYFCVQVEKGNFSNPDFLLSQPPSIVCQSITCRGVEVTNTSITIGSGTPVVENRNQHQVTFDLNIDTSPSGGRVSGANLWTVQLYASSSDISGSGLPTASQGVDLTPIQSSTGILTPGSPVTLRGLSAMLDLSGLACSDLQYVCAVLGRNPISSPPFTLMPVPDQSVLTTCTPVTCRGVLINSVDYNIRSGQPFQASTPNNQFTFDLTANSLATGASVSGQNLWQVEVFTNTQSNGLGTAGLLQTAFIPFSAGSSPITAGEALNLDGLQANFDLTSFACADVPFLCVRLSKNPDSSTDFTLSGVSSSSLLSCKGLVCEDPDPCDSHQCLNGATCVAMDLTYRCQCLPGWTDNFCQTAINLCTSTPCRNGGECENFQTFFTCSCPLGWEGDRCQFVDQGVIMQFVRLVVNSGIVRQGTLSQLELDISLVSHPAGKGIAGSGLWQVTLFPSRFSTGTGETVVPVFTPVLTALQSGTSLASGGQATIAGVSYNLNLNGVACSDIPYLCVRVAKGPNPDPNFLLTGSLIHCAPSNCRGVNITGLHTSILSGFSLRENSNSNEVRFSLRINSDSSGGSVLGTDLWAINTFASNQPDGSGPRLGLTNNIQLTPAQSGTPALAGILTQMSNVITNVDLTGIDCSQFAHFCVELSKSVNPSVDFDVIPDRGVACAPLRCLGVEISTAIGTINSGIPLTSGEPNTINFDLSATSNLNYASVSGSSLWQVLVYTTFSFSGAPDTSSSQQLAIIPGLQADQDFVAGGQLDLTNMQVTIDLTGIDCIDFSYLCLLLQRDPASSVPFTLTGNRQFCQQVSCAAPSPCTASSCLNGGICVEQGDSFSCNCLVGWVGPTCLNDNPCIPSNPCQNFGSCLPNNDGTYSCLCFNGYTGFNCETPPDPCLSFPCNNAGMCSRIGTTANFQCTCLTGYSGFRCDNVDRCILENPCRNGAACVPNILLGTYQCTCPTGFKGLQCQFPDSCFPNPCQNQGTCSSDEFGQTYTCNCQPGFTGTSCEFQDLCFVNPCQNGGTCSSFTPGTRQCTCLQHFSGNLCQFDNPCFPSNPCQNGGSCSPDPTGAFAVCQCTVGFVGPTCSLTSPCSSQPCRNDGICQVSATGLSYSCLCNTLLWVGTNCDTAVVCVGLPCNNGGLCVPSADATTFTCDCLPGYSGATCLVRELCNPSPCQNGGVCSSSGGTYSCSCPLQFLGFNCQTPDPCQPNPCLNSGVCTAVSQGLSFACTCLQPQRFYGPTCGFINGCFPNPCQNSGLCQATDVTGATSCSCAPGFTGDFCTDIDPCSLDPCRNGGQCVDDQTLPSGYRCICTSTFIGTNCDIFNLCSAGLCYNNGICTLIDNGNDFECSCTDQFVGDQCHLPNPCNPNPCLNGGLCTSELSTVPPSFSCSCLQDFSGDTCEINLLICPDPNDFMCNTGVCISQSQRCNNVLNCADFSDEINCPVPCLSGMFACTSILQCISSFLRCDGIHHCADGTDEGQICQNPCDPNPCQNGGTCAGEIGQSDFTCTCTTQFTGGTCATDRESNAPPSFNYFTTPTFTITEGQSPSILVATLDATDPDDDPIRFGLEDDNARAIFTLVPETGQLYANPGIDREFWSSRVTVKVSVTDGINDNVRQNIIVSIEDINDNAPDLVNLPNETYVYENASFGTELFLVQSTDPDSGLNAAVSYVLAQVTPTESGMTPTDYFSIAPFGGMIKLAAPLDYEMVQQYLLTIVAQDYGPGDRSLSSTATLTVNVLDIQDTNPVFINIPYDVAIPETAPVDTVVQTIMARDPDSFNQNTITYELLVADSQGYFTIDPISGVITVATPMDVDNPNLPTQYPLVVRANEISSGGSSFSLVSFDVTISAANDEAPVFDLDAYSVSIPESTQVNALLPTTISIDDGDRITDSTITISLQNGNAAAFRPAPNQVFGSGAVGLQLLQPLDFEDEQTYTYLLLATDGDGQDTATLTVIVTDVNDNDPVFLNVPPQGFYRGAINENAPADTFVVQVSTSDADSGSNADVTYSIAGGNTGNVFSIDPDTGVITNNQILGPNNPSSYTLIVMATNPTAAVPPATGSSTSTVIITVNDVNDSPPIFRQDEYIVTINEAAQIGTTVMRITADDADIPEGDQLTYAIVTGNPEGHFQINAATGDVTLLRQLDREMQPRHSLTIRATDQGAPPQFATTLLTVIVLDFNDNAPQWSQILYEVDILEGSPLDTFVVQVIATDQDQGANANLTFTINNANNLPFTIDSAGIISTNGPLDRETVPQYTLLVTAVDNGVPRQAANPPATVVVNIIDVNDEQPSLTQDSYHFTISEDAAFGALVGQITADDPDITGSITFTFMPTDPDFNYSPSGTITTNAPLDATSQSTYQMAVVASDGIQDSLPATVTITVMDINNQPPVFRQGTYVRILSEDSPFQTLVVDLNATDLDNGNNGNIIYSFQSLRRTEGPFSVDPFTGIVETSAALDRETQDEYTLVVIAVDAPGSGVSMTGTATVSVLVTDINDNAPVFRNITYERSVFENIPPGSPILTVRADDADLAENAIVLYRIISGNANDAFTVDDFGNINLGSTPLDRETQDRYFFIVQAYNSDLSVGTDQAAVTINVLDVNDVVPSFLQQVYLRPDLLENSQIGTPVIMVLAQDQDLDQGGMVEYSLTGNPPFLTIDSITGQISVAGPIPDDSDSRNYTMTVRATDQASPFLQSTATVIVTVIDATVLVPVFSLPRYAEEIDENVPLDTFVTEVSATLGGSPAGITYAIDPNANPAVLDLFKIDPIRGTITTDGVIDREVEDFYAFTVFAYGGDVAPGSTSVWVTIRDMNDNAPNFVTVPPSPVSVVENQLGSVRVGLFSVTDADDGINAQLIFEISGTGSNQFSVFQNGEGSGVILAIQPLDRESDDFYQLTVTATDRGSPPLSSSFPLNITVTDVNDNYPVWTSSLFQGSISENNFTASPIVTVSVNDADLPSSNNFEYSIISGNPENLFQINDNGQITLTNLLDRELEDTYQLTVLLRDETNGPPAQTTTLVLITVDDVNDNTPTFQEAVYRVNVTEGPTSVGIPVIRVVASDFDAGLNRQIVYEISSQQPEAHFQITPTSGLITTTTALDWEAIPQYTLLVTATDQSPTDPKTGTATVIVAVNDINDFAPRFDREFYGPYSVLEEIPNSYIDMFQASDTDQGEAGVLVYSITGLYSDLFNIQPATGVLTIGPDRALDYESITEFNITVVAEDKGNPTLSSSTLVGIEVININDHSPMFVGTPYAITISKNVSSGSLVYIVRATDNDVGIYGEVGYQITEGNVDDVFRIDNVTGEIVVNGLLETGTYRLLVEARDTPGDIPSSRVQSTTVTIVVTDIGDLAPIFPGSSLFTGSVFENAPLGENIPMVPPIRAVDSDATGLLVYAITGSDSTAFYIDPASGMIQVNTNQLDRETKDFYEFQVIVTDSMGLTAEGTVNINILDYNDFTPTFNDSVYNFTIPENSPGGVFVGMVYAYDLDGDAMNFYIQTGGEDKFEIDPTTGMITVAPGAMLDREEKSVYTITVYVSDLRNPPLRSTAIVYVHLSDVNDSPPTFDVSLLDQIITIPEDTPSDTHVTTVIATDADFNVNINYDVVSVDVYDQDDNDITSTFDYRTVFSVNPVTGNITLISAVDREITERFVFSISAVDLNSENAAFGTSLENARITILITDVNDNAPTFQPPGADVITLRLPESLGAGGPVPGTIVALDPDLGLNGMVIYVIQGDISGLPVSIDQNTGQLTLRETIDREVLPWVNLTILAVDRGTPSLNTSIPVYIEIVDNNDNNPSFEFPMYVATVNESAPVGTFVIRVDATDVDAGGNGFVTYSLIGGDEKFTIDPITGVITLRQPVDKESQSKYTLTVFAHDNPGDSEDSRTGSTTVVVTVLDTNEHPPVVEPPIFNIQEGGASGEVVGVIEASDPDDPDDPTQELYYVIVGSQPSVGTTLFVINNVTGVITSTGPLDRDNGTHPPVVNLEIIVYDGGNPDLGTPVTAVINIEDINDNVPTFEKPIYVVLVPESQPTGEVIVTVVATDPDENSDLTYAITGGNINGTFIINSNAGTIIPIKSLDYETLTVYNLTVVVTDSGGQSSTTYVEIPVGDANDQIPIFIQDPYIFSVRENRDPGTEVGVVDANDGDSHSQFADIIYTILMGDDQGQFSINQSTGVITTSVALDREEIGDYILVIGAQNPLPAVGGFTGTTSVSILVLDENDNTPLFDENPYITDLTSNTGVIEVHAEDPDELANGFVTYEIISGNVNNLFTIDNGTGLITLSNGLQSPLVRNYTLIVVARDLGMPSLQSNTTVHIDVSYLGSNFHPTFIRPTLGQRINIRENNPVGIVIFNAYARDNDFGNNGIVDYSLQPIDDYNLFSIDPVTGNITIKVSADRETTQRYRLTIVATDRGNPALSTSQTLVIGVLDENDNDPYFIQRDVQVLHIVENANISDLVGRITLATDLDIGENAVIYYYIVDGTSGGHFVINSTTGEITVNGTLDREVLGSHTLIILATNDPNYVPGDGPFNVADNVSLTEVRINLIDVNDNGPLFPETQISACIPLDSRLGREVVSIAVIDPDGDSTLDITYSIQAAVFVNSDGVRNAAPTAFRINPITGSVSTNQEFTQTYLQGYFDLVVLARDNVYGESAVATIRICILDYNQQVVVIIDRGITIVENKRELLIEVLEDITGGTVFIDDITNARDDNGEIIPDQTQVLIHVVDPATGEVIDANVVTALIDENAMSIEVLLDGLHVVEVYPLFGGGGLGGLGLLEAALLAFGILLFLGALIFSIILCCLRRRLLRKLQGGGVTLGKAQNDLLKEKRDASYQGSNPLWLDNDTSQPDDWPDSISLLGGGAKDYEAQEATMNFLSDEIPVEIAEEAVVMTSMVNEKSVRNKMANGRAHMGNGYPSGFASIVQHVDSTDIDGGRRSLQNTVNRDGSVSAQMQSTVHSDGSASARMQHPWGGVEEKYASISRTVTKSAPPPRDVPDSGRAQYATSTRSSTILRENTNSLRHRKMLTEETAAEIREMLQDMPVSNVEQEADMAAAAYREQMTFETELTPITEEESLSSRSTNTRAGGYRDQDSLDRNKRGGTISKQYTDPMSKYSGQSSLEEQYKEEEIDGKNSRTSIKSYSSRRVTNKVYTGGDMGAIPELDSGHMLGSGDSRLAIQDERSSLSESSGPKGRTYTYQVLHDSGGSGTEGHSEASRTLSSQSDDSGSRTGEFVLPLNDEDGDADVVEERQVRRTIKRTMTTGLSDDGGGGGSYRNYGFIDEESAL